ncbi:MAG: hypothetical protein K5770_20690 [Lachnospiraceae bacterium]|nr:hypothetical protein [Lachnospiraceae bacterium]
MKKGEKDYIAFQKKKTLIITICMYCLAAGIYLLGYHTLHTNKNLFTVIAVLSILPASKWAVRAIMFLKTPSTKKEFYEELSGITQGLNVMYDLVFTTYEKVYTVRALVYGGGNICMYSETDAGGAKKLSEHVQKNVLSDPKELSVKVYIDKEAFFKRSGELKEHFSKETSGQKEPAFFEKIRAVVL